MFRLKLLQYLFVLRAALIWCLYFVCFWLVCLFSVLHEILFYFVFCFSYKTFLLACCYVHYVDVEYQESKLISGFKSA